MEPSPDISAHQKNLAELQANSLRTIALLVGSIGYGWLGLLIWPESRVPAPLAAWVGSLFLVLGAGLAYLLRLRAPHLGSALLLVGILSGVAGALVTFRAAGLAYLFLVPIIVASVLLRQQAVFLVASLVVVVDGALSLGVLGLPSSSGDVWLPIAVTLVVAVASWLSARNLYTALDWVWSGYERAHRNEQMARAGQAELRRALKALDEATYRLERSNYMLSVARDQAEEARRLKQQFAQTISHELRTPLNLIVGFTRLMSQSPEYYGGPLSPAYMRDLSIVHRNACHLQGLVNDVLDLARIEAAQMGLLPEETDPAALVREAVNTARSLVESRGLALCTEIEPDLPHLWLDPTRIRQVLFNLLSNAVRFTEKGKVTVSAHCQGEEVVFAVADTGAGIAAEDIPRVFQEFRQLDAGRRRRHEGAGLGLAISRRFVELHGGRIWVESEPGRGSTFYFSLPVNRLDLLASSGAGRELSPAAVREPSLAAVREMPLLLAVTRSPAAAGLLTRYLRGCRAVVVQDLEQARQAARQLLPQGVFIDTAEINLDPTTFASLPQTWSLPRGLFLACALPGEEPTRQRLAVDGYLVKPISRESLWNVLRPFGENVDRILVVDDDADFVRLLQRLLESPLRRYQTLAAYSGQEALEIAAHHPPDLILLDLILPDMHGREVIARIRASGIARQIPIVIVSAQDEMITLGSVEGAMLIARGGGMQPADVLRWVENAMGGKPSVMCEP